MEQTGSAELGQGVHYMLIRIETFVSESLTRQEEKKNILFSTAISR